VRDIVAARALPPISVKGVGRMVVPYVVEGVLDDAGRKIEIFSEHITGLDFYLDPRAIDATGNVRGFELGLQLLGRGGVLVTVGGSAMDQYAAVSPSDLVTRQIDIRASQLGANQYEACIDILARGQYPLERLVTQALNSPHGAALDPGVADTLARSAADSAKRQEDLGHPACLLVPDMIRAPMARLLKRAAPRLRVLGHSEIPETHSIRIGSIIGAHS